MLGSLYRSDRGATAIEYAIIAGLIGLGLVGSLVTTRGSLRAVFGGAGSQMGAATAAGPSAPLVSTAGTTQGDYWNAKGLLSATKVKDGQDNFRYTFTYSDGSSVIYVTNPYYPLERYVSTSDAALSQTKSYSYYSDGAFKSYSYSQFTDSTYSKYQQGDSTISTNFNYSPGGVPSQYNILTFDSNGNNTGSRYVTPSAGLDAGFSDMRSTLDVFQVASGKI